MQGAVATIEAARPGEPVIASNLMLYTSVLTYIEDRRQVFQYLPVSGIPFYQGTAVMLDEEYADSAWLSSMYADGLWILDAGDSMGRVPIPSDWRLVGEEAFQEWFANLTVRLYVRKASD